MVEFRGGGGGGQRHQRIEVAQADSHEAETVTVLKTFHELDGNGEGVRAYQESASYGS